MAALSETQRLVEIDAIRTLKARRIRALDLHEWGTYEALHAPDYEADNEGEEPVRGAKENAERLRKLYEEVGMVSVHHVHSPEITLLSPTSAEGIWAMEDRLFWQQDGEQHWLNGFGFYYERYEKRSGDWLFTSRRLRRTKVMLSPGARIGNYVAPRA